MNEFDTGSNYEDSKSPEEQAFENAMNLTPAEKKIAEDIDKRMAIAASKFTFFVRKQQVAPDTTSELAIRAKFKGETLKMLKWLQCMCIDGGWITGSELGNRIFQAGIKAVYEEEQQGMAAAALHKKMLEHMPEPIARATMIGAYRQGIEHQKRVETKKIEESFNAPSAEGKE